MRTPSPLRKRIEQQGFSPISYSPPWCSNSPAFVPQIRDRIAGTSHPWSCDCGRTPSLLSREEFRIFSSGRLAPYRAYACYVLLRRRYELSAFISSDFCVRKVPWRDQTHAIGLRSSHCEFSTGTTGWGKPHHCRCVPTWT